MSKRCSLASIVPAATSLLIGIVIFIGLPLLGWGLGDVPGFFANPARLGYVILTLVLQLAIVIAMPGAGRDRGPGVNTVRRQRLALFLLQVIPLAIVIGGPFCDRRNVAVMGESDLVRYAGLGFYALGILGMHWAEAFLGKQFSVQVTIQEGHQLVTAGPYRYLRHPRYLGIILFTAGIALVFRSWLALVLVAALTVVLVWRIQDEEALMRQQFGAEWEAYAQRSWRLIPFAY